MKKILKNKKGFTLVELIVVIAILGVLAVIMVPAFTGYIQKAQNANKITSAKSYCTAYQAYWAEYEAGTSGDSSFDEDTLGGLWSGDLPDATYYEADENTGTCTVNVTGGVSGTN